MIGRRNSSAADLYFEFRFRILKIQPIIYLLYGMNDITFANIQHTINVSVPVTMIVADVAISNVWRHIIAHGRKFQFRHCAAMVSIHAYSTVSDHAAHITIAPRSVTQRTARGAAYLGRDTVSAISAAVCPSAWLRGQFRQHGHTRRN